MKTPLAISTLALAFVISACQPVAPPLEPTTPPKAEVQPSPTTTEAPVPTVPPTTVAPTSTTVPPTAPPPSDAVPANAIVVAPNGNDNAAGTSAAPLRTATKAISRATSGSTIVFRGGTYHEAFKTPANKALTLRSWPGETVWFDGSEVMTAGWAKDGTRWKMEGWTIDFDNSPSYTRGAADGTTADWTFINPSYPMAAHPDQVWIDGVVQRQVGSLGEVVPGTFFEDGVANRLYLGTDPTGHEVRASTLGRAVLADGPDTTIRGLNFRRFSPSIPDVGAVVMTGARATVADLVVTESATIGLAVINADSVIRNVEVSYAGLLGIHAASSDRLLVENVNAHHNNSERFNMAPVSGGFKFGRLRGLTVKNSKFNNNHGPGIWADVSPYDMTIVGSEFVGNAGHGISLELSAKAFVANNVISSNGGNGIKVNNTSEVQILNNTFIGNNRTINIVQDSRTPENTSYGHNPARPKPDPTMPWINKPVLVQGNVIAHQKAGNCILCVEDYSGKYSAEQLQVSAAGNLYSQEKAGSIQYFIVWSRGAGNPAVYASVTAFNKGTGQEQVGRHVIGAAPVDSTGRAVVGADLSGSPAVSAAVAAKSGLTAGRTLFGAQR